jgi:CBS-domain-containing membrane protein
MMSISTCCPTFDAGQSFRPATCECRPYFFVLPEAPARSAAVPFSAAACALRLCFCEWFHHHRGVGAPGVFPSLGPTAYLLFFTPLGRTSSPRNTVFGHAIGLVCGYAAFVATGAGALPFAEHPGIFWPRVLAAAISLSATGAFMVLLDASHPPAGATTLIVSLGIISKPRELAIIEVAVFLLVAQALAINRLAGLPYPLWDTPARINREGADRGGTL